MYIVYYIVYNVIMYNVYNVLFDVGVDIILTFQTLIAHAPALQDQLQANATTQSILEKNGEGLLGDYL